MVTICSAALAMFLLGAVYAYGVLLPALMVAFGWERSTAAFPHALLLFVYAVGMGVGGWLLDRRAPRRIAMLGGALFGGGVLLGGLLANRLGLIIGYGILGGFGFGFAYVAAVTAAMHTYPFRRGLVAGIVVGAFGLGAFAWAPLAQMLLPALGWQGILRNFGLLALVALPLLALGFRLPQHTPHAASLAYVSRGIPLPRALRMPLFWLIFAAYSLATSVGLMLLAHLVNYGIGQGIPASTAAWLLSATAIGSGLGRIGMGALSDQIGRLPSLVLASVLEVVLLVGLGWIAAPAGLFLLAGLTGFAFGTWLALYGPTATDLFGLRYAGAIYGALYLSYGLGGLIGPTLGGALADIGGYRAAFLAGAVLCAVAALLFFIAFRLPAPAFPHLPAQDEEIPG